MIIETRLDIRHDRGFFDNKENLVTISTRLIFFTQFRLCIQKMLLDENGIVLIVLPQSKEIENLDGFATTFFGIPIIALVQKVKKDYRRMFFTLGHELYHLLFAEGEDLANSFPGRLFMPKEKFQPFIKSPKNLEKDMPELLKAFPYNSAWSIANTAKSYGLISEEERASWNNNKSKKRNVHKEIHAEPYQWHSQIEQFKDVKPKEVESELYENYLKALKALKAIS